MQLKAFKALIQMGMTTISSLDIYQDFATQEQRGETGIFLLDGSINEK